MKTGIELITEERARQIEVEGWNYEHDDNHKNGELEMAGLTYFRYALHPSSSVPTTWPWGREWWKPSGHVIRNLEKAGALYLAESERLARDGDYEGEFLAKVCADQCAEEIDKIYAAPSYEKMGFESL